MSTENPNPMAQRAYAKRRGVSAEAVGKAIAEGRLRESVVMVDGVAKIADPELADREWEANTRPRADEPRTSQRADIPDYYESRAKREAAAARREAALADLAEIEVAERKGELVSVEDARRDVLEKFTLVKTRLLGVPSRVAQRLPQLAGQVVPVLDELLREALEELAEGEDDEGEGADEEIGP